VLTEKKFNISIYLKIKNIRETLALFIKFRFLYWELLNTLKLRPSLLLVFYVRNKKKPQDGSIHPNTTLSYCQSIKLNVTCILLIFLLNLLKMSDVLKPFFSYCDNNFYNNNINY
jgi:hypothetical protein